MTNEAMQTRAVMKQEPPSSSTAVRGKTPDATAAKESEHITIPVRGNAPSFEAASPDGQEEEATESDLSADEQESLIATGVTMCLGALFMFGLFLLLIR